MNSIIRYLLLILVLNNIACGQQPGSTPPAIPSSAPNSDVSGVKESQQLDNHAQTKAEIKFQALLKALNEMAAEDSMAYRHQLFELATWQSSIGDNYGLTATKRRIQTALKSIRQESERVMFLCRIAILEIRSGNAESGIAATQHALVGIDGLPASDGSYYLTHFAKDLAEIGRIEQAFEMAKRLTREQEYALSLILPYQACDGEFQKSMQSVRNISNSGLKARTLVEIAKLRSAKGDIDGFRSIIDEALKSANLAYEQNGHSYFKISEAQAQAGLIANAKESAEKIGAATDNIYRDQALGVIAEHIAEKGDLDSAIETIRTIEHDRHKTIALAEITRGAARCGDHIGCRNLALQVMELASQKRMENYFAIDTIAEALEIAELDKESQELRALVTERQLKAEIILTSLKVIVARDPKIVSRLSRTSAPAAEIVLEIPKIEKIELKTEVSAPISTSSLELEPTYKQKPLSVWMNQLKTGDLESRRDASFALSEIGADAKEAVSVLSRALLDTDEEVVKLSALALGRIGEAGVPALITGFTLQSETLRDAAAVGLIAAGKPAVRPLVRLLRSRTKSTVALASATLGQIGKPAVVELVEALKSDEVQVRGFALLTLGRIGETAREAVPAVRERLTDSHEGVRKIAIEVLYKIDRQREIE